MHYKPYYTVKDCPICGHTPEMTVTTWSIDETTVTLSCCGYTFEAGTPGDCTKKWNIFVCDRDRIMEGGISREMDILKNVYSKQDVKNTMQLYYLMNAGYGRTRHVSPYIERVIFNDPATIVLWSDGTKTVVKAQDGETYDPEKGLALAISKKALGNQGNYYNEFDKWLKEHEKKKQEDFKTTLDEAEKAMKKLSDALGKK